MLGSLAAGCFLALVMGKADHSLYTPDDITKRIGIRIIGTTTNIDYLDTLKLPEQISCDYQTIRANLGMMNGDHLPHKLVVTSAGMLDGKTTFAINMATSLAKAGKKVLLIDGDLRKPDIRNLLKLPEEPRGFDDLLLGRTDKKLIHTIPSIGLDVLTANIQNMSEIFELLSRPHVRGYLNTISAKYDHVIIDTPPVMAFPDALLFAKMAGAVILTSFVGRTERNDLKETIERLEQINVKILGTVLNNVKSSHSYNRYGYGYYVNRNRAKKNNSRKRKTNKLLLPMKEFRKDHKDSKSSQKNINSTEKI